MGNRLSKIYTRTGDKGKTGLGEGTRVSKDHPRVAAYGSVDELNSIIGLLRTYSLPDPLEQALIEIQHDLFDLGGELCIPGHSLLRSEQVDLLEKALDELNSDLTPLKEFILPGGTRAAALFHFARTVARRAERDLVTLSRQEQVTESSLQYLNRLSDLLFVMARWLNHHEKVADVLWDRARVPERDPGESE